VDARRTSNPKGPGLLPADLLPADLLPDRGVDSLGRAPKSDLLHGLRLSPGTRARLLGQNVFNLISSRSRARPAVEIVLNFSWPWPPPRLRHCGERTLIV
jgi:hypothetical protein